MKVTLHIGAHRTATTSFQTYARTQGAPLMRQGVGFWGPMRTRKGLFAGIQPVPGLGRDAAHRARGRIALNLEKARANGVQRLVISDENMMGSVRRNLRARRLYPDVGERIARYVAAFDGQIDRIVMSVRDLDHFWASATAYGVARGHVVPDATQCTDIAASDRTWRDVITDVACAAPGAEIKVVPFEQVASHPDRLCAACSDVPAPAVTTPVWLNRTPGAMLLRTILTERGDDPDLIRESAHRWTPFDSGARAALREAYSDDMFWLVSGADGLATLTRNLDHTRAGHTPPYGPLTRGQTDDGQERRMAHARRG